MLTPISPSPRPPVDRSLVDRKWVSSSCGWSRSIFRVLEVETRARVPFFPLVPVGGEAAGVLQHPGQVQQVPGHEGGVAVGEVVVQTGAGAVVQQVAVAGSWPRLADPAGVGLRRNAVPDVLQAVQDVRGAVLDAVLVAGDQAASDPAVV